MVFKLLSIGCVIHHYVRAKKQKTKYYFIACAETNELNLFNALPDAHSAVNRLCEICGNLKEETMKYFVQCLSSPTTLAKSEKQKVMRKHKSIRQKERIRVNKRKYHRTVSPVKKKALPENMVLKYNKLDSFEKKRFS